MTEQKKVIVDIETADPDSFLALLLMLGHPKTEVAGVTISPGNDEQIGLIKKALNWFDLKIPIGSYNINYDKKSVSDWYIQTFGKIKPSRDAFTASELLVDLADSNTFLFSGGSQKNIAAAIKTGQKQNRTFKLNEVFIQGGFAGANIVPKKFLPEKFHNKTTYHSLNLETDRKSSWLVIKSNLASRKNFISENICQNIYFTPELNELLSPHKKHNLAIALIWKAMDKYFVKHSKSKKVPCLFAASCMINSVITEWAEVELFRKNKGWGVNKKNETGYFIAVNYDHDTFIRTLMEY